MESITVNSMESFPLINNVMLQGKIMRSLVIFLLLFSQFSFTAHAAFESDEEISNWTTYYYQNPTPTKTPEFIEYLSKSGIFDNQNSITPIMGFLSGVFKNNPDQITPTLDKITKTNKSHIGVVVLGIWYANLPESKEIVYGILENNPALKKEIEFLYRGNPMEIVNIPLEQGPWVLDALWGNFMATGNKAPVERIITALPWIDTKGDMSKLIVGGSARWSLTSNATQHPSVLKICENSLPEAPPEVAGKLIKVIENAKKELK